MSSFIRTVLIYTLQANLASRLTAISFTKSVLTDFCGGELNRTTFTGATRSSILMSYFPQYVSGGRI